MTYDDEVSLSASGYTMTGYTFIGWDTDSQAANVVYNDTQKVKNLASDNGSIVSLYAVWQANQYHVTFDSHGGSGTMIAQTFVYNQEQALTQCSFNAPTGLKFSSWNTAADGTGAIYNDGASVKNLTAAANGSVILYAQWIDKSAHAIHYYNTKGAEIPTDKQSFLESHDFELSNISAVGWIFDGWYDQEFGGTKIEGWAAGEKTGDVDLYGRWSADTVNYAVKTYFQNVDGIGYEQSELSYPNQTESGLTESQTNVTANDDVTGFELQPIEQQTIAADGSTVVNIYYNRSTIELTFKANGGNWSGSTNDKTVSGLFGANVTGVPANPARDGYEFAGWDKTVPSVFGATGETFTAQWILGNGAITVVTPTYQDIDGLLTYSDGTFTALSGYQSYKWYIDEERQAEINQTLTPDTSSLSAGRHSVMVVVTDSQGRAYSAEMTFQVKKSY
jgi:uncharacterized repeat protein (TIGR02543 family)